MLSADTENWHYTTAVTFVTNTITHVKDQVITIPTYTMDLKMYYVSPKDYWLWSGWRQWYGCCNPQGLFVQQYRQDEIQKRIIAFVKDTLRISEDLLLQTLILETNRYHPQGQPGNHGAGHGEYRKVDAKYNKIIAFHGTDARPEDFSNAFDGWTVVLNEHNPSNLYWCSSYAVQRDKPTGYIYVLEIKVPSGQEIEIMDSVPCTIRGDHDIEASHRMQARTNHGGRWVDAMYPDYEKSTYIPDSIIFNKRLRDKLDIQVLAAVEVKRILFDIYNSEHYAPTAGIPSK